MHRDSDLQEGQKESTPVRSWNEDAGRWVARDGPHSCFTIASRPPQALNISLSSSPRNTLQTHLASSRHSSVSSPLRSRSTRAPNPRQTTTARATTAPSRTMRRRQLGSAAAMRQRTPRKMPRWARAVCAWCARRWSGVRGGPAYMRTRGESARG